MRKYISISLLVILLLMSTPQLIFAESTSYIYNNGNITISLDDSEWAVLEPSDREFAKEALGEDAFNYIYGIFDSSDAIKMIAFSPDYNCLWYFGLKDGCDTKALSSLSEDEVRSLNLNDYSDEEIKSLDLTSGIAAGLSSDYTVELNPTMNDVDSFGNTKYFVGAGDATLNGVKTSIQYYMTIINGYYYMFCAYPMEGDFSNNSIDKIESILESVVYKQSTVDAIPENEPDSPNEEEVHKSALMSTLMTVVPVAIVFAVVGAFFRSKKGKKNILEKPNKSEYESSDLLVPNQNKVEANENTAKENASSIASDKDPTEELKRYKQLMDDGLITQEDYDKLKAKVLGL